MDLASKAGTSKKVTNVRRTAKPRWPLAFKIRPQAPQGLTAFGVTSTKQAPKKRWWSHVLYRGPGNEPVRILYSKTKAESEALAKQFLTEEVVGFDMEWPWDDWRKPNTLQNKVGLIQVATEDKIALFHIGLHTGETTDDIIAPSLRKLIESPSIGKVGVGILHADFARLIKYLKLSPKAAVELSHLHRLTTFGERKPELVSTKLTSLAHQVEQHLGHPLYKGDVRTSNWSKPLTRAQIKYAAGDAYAGVMLYHYLNFKRLQMNPTPPMPIHADKYLGTKLNGINSLHLEPLEEGGKIMTSAVFFGVPTAPQDLSKSKKPANSSKSTATKVTVKSVAASTESTPNSALDITTQALYDELLVRRKAFAAEAELAENRVVPDRVLEAIARERPLSRDALLKVKGVGPLQDKRYGQGWIEVISSFTTRNGTLDTEHAVLASNPTSATPKDIVDTTILPPTPARDSTREVPSRSETPDSSPAFGTPPPRTRQLHTGLSFTLAETKIIADASTAEGSDDSLPSLDFGDSERRTSGQKRKWSESPKKRQFINRAQTLQQAVEEFESKGGVVEGLLQKSVPKVDHDISSADVWIALSPQTKIFRNKLLAFTKLVATKTQRDATQLVSPKTLEMVARRPPQTHEELRQVPGIEELFHACTESNMDLLQKINKFAPAREGPSPSS